MNLTQTELKLAVEYSPNTGDFTTLMNSKRLKRGSKVGHHDKDGYIQVSVKGKRYRAHRLAVLYMKGYWPENEVDHLNRIRDDNRWMNLEEKGHQCNIRNAKVKSTSKTGISGVSWCVKLDKWRSHIVIDNRQKHLGYFKDFVKAVVARWQAEKKYNFPECCTLSSSYAFLVKNKCI